MDPRRTSLCKSTACRLHPPGLANLSLCMLSLTWSCSSTRQDEHRSSGPMRSVLFPCDFTRPHGSPCARINAPGPSLAGCMPTLCFQYRFTLLIGFVARHGSALSLIAPLSLSGNAKPLAPLGNPVLRNETPVLPPPLTLPMQTTNEACVYENKPAWLFSTGPNRSPATRLVFISPSSGRTEC